MDPVQWNSLFWPIVAGVGATTAALFLWWYLSSFIRKLALKTKTSFDDIIVNETRLPSLFWCVWLGVYIGYKIAQTPVAWIRTETMAVSALSVSLVIYTAVAIITAILKWYRVEVCPQTAGNLDKIIVFALIRLVPVISAVLGIIWVLRIFGIKNQAIDTWLSQHLASLATLTIISVVLILAVMLAIPKIIYQAVVTSKEEQTEEETQQRADTLVGVIVTVLQLTIIFVYFVMILSEFNFNVTAILTGAGVLGLAVGFGAQSLVKDLIAGLFVIMENQYRKGDVVQIAGISGVVEEINLRRTMLRDLDGVIHIVPNGEISIASNKTKVFSRVNLNISVSYDTDLEQAMAVINRVGKEMAQDPAWKRAIISPPKALRVDKLGDSGIDIKILGETKPMKQWEIMGELRLRLKKAFDKEGIEIPWPHTKVYFGNAPAKPPFKENKQP